MLIEIARVSEVGVVPSAAWSFVRDVARLTACIPNISEVKTVEADRRYNAVVSDSLGPFKLTFPVQIEVEAIDAPCHISAALTGNDTRGQARVKGTLDAQLEPLDSGTRLVLSMRMEVVGKLASLGSVPIRRRADQIVSQFVQCLAAELQTT